LSNLNVNANDESRRRTVDEPDVIDFVKDYQNRNSNF